jgi:hypothetical protein
MFLLGLVTGSLIYLLIGLGVLSTEEKLEKRGDEMQRRYFPLARTDRRSIVLGWPFSMVVGGLLYCNQYYNKHLSGSSSDRCPECRRRKEESPTEGEDREP